MTTPLTPDAAAQRRARIERILGRARKALKESEKFEGPASVFWTVDLPSLFGEAGSWGPPWCEQRDWAKKELIQELAWQVLEQAGLRDTASVEMFYDRGHYSSAVQRALEILEWTGHFGDPVSHDDTLNVANN